MSSQVKANIRQKVTTRSRANFVKDILPAEVIVVNIPGLDPEAVKHGQD